MNVFVLGKASREASIMNVEWLFWVSLWWVVWYAILMEWYSRGVKAGTRPKMHPLVAFMMFLFAGFTPIVALIMLFTGATKR